MEGLAPLIMAVWMPVQGPPLVMSQDTHATPGIHSMDQLREHARLMDSGVGVCQLVTMRHSLQPSTVLLCM